MGLSRLALYINSTQQIRTLCPCDKNINNNNSEFLKSKFTKQLEIKF